MLIYGEPTMQVKPFHHDGHLTVYITEEEAIKRQHKRGIYLSDADALDEFIVVNWACEAM